ncbi:hypothetical protein [Lunatibacter salilacus]|uniref:hypothetical protein n=1 Tax=Lunatibacter salilacus TaxID=2483804 RepID=UPI00131DD87D|nr:hypothetical protein [Lunatibacter salilacus]
MDRGIAMDKLIRETAFGSSVVSPIKVGLSGLIRLQENNSKEQIENINKLRRVIYREKVTEVITN